MQRVLDIDLDFFVEPIVYFAEGGDERPDPGEHTVRPADGAIELLRARCGLTHRTPGFLTETHVQLFPAWRQAIEAGILRTPFHVTHVDGRADLGLGDTGHEYLMTSLLFEESADRAYPSPLADQVGLTEGNFLLYAIACRWIGDLTYVHLDGVEYEEFHFTLKDFQPGSDAIQLRAMTPAAYTHWMRSGFRGKPVIANVEPEVPYQRLLWHEFQAQQPYDFVCLTRSPLYAPLTADPLYELIADAFIEPIVGQPN
jgi:hypothetical protein